MNNEKDFSVSRMKRGLGICAILDWFRIDGNISVSVSYVMDSEWNKTFLLVNVKCYDHVFEVYVKGK